MEKLKRYLIFIAGLFISSLGVSLVTKADLGTSPISAIPYVLSLHYPWSLGQFTIAFSLFLIALQLIILRRNFKAEHLLQIPISVAFGYFIDLTMVMLSFVNPQMYIMKLVFLLIGCVILAFGVYLEVLADVAMLPGESFVRTIKITWNTDFGITKIAFDVSMTVIAIAISLLLSHRLLGVREGTVIAALIVGFIARLYGRLLSPALPKLLRLTSEKKAETISAEEAHQQPYIIAIGRQTGSGGHIIGEALAKRLNYAFYDEEIIQMAAGTSGYSTDFIQQAEESMTNSFLYDLVNQMYAYAPQQSSPKDAIFASEKKVIEELAGKGNCVIVGRCADYILRENPRCLCIWLHGSREKRSARLMRVEGLDAQAARIRIAQDDRKRSTNYQYYTKQVWGLSRNYDLTVNTDLGEAYTQNAIINALEALQQKNNAASVQPEPDTALSA